MNRQTVSSDIICIQLILLTKESKYLIVTNTNTTHNKQSQHYSFVYNQKYSNRVFGSLLNI